MPTPALHFHVSRDARREWRWHLKAANGEIIATSGEGYRRKAGCLHAIGVVRAGSAAATVHLPPVTPKPKKATPPCSPN